VIPAQPGAKEDEHRDYRGLGRIYFASGSRLMVDYLYREIFRHDEYLRHGIKLAPGDTVFDVGANIGLFALRAAQACGNDLRLFAFEPVPETFRHLEKNLRLHGLAGAPGIHLVNAGLGAAGGPATLSFTLFPRAPALASTQLEFLARDHAVVRQRLFSARYLFAEVRRRGGWLFPFYWIALAAAYPVAAPYCRRIFNEVYADRGQVLCAMTSFSAVVREHRVERIDLLKVDVEGAELDVLRSIAPDDWPKVRQVVVEVHDFDGRLDEAQRLLHAAGFERIVTTRPTLLDVFKYTGCMVYARRP
jgi:FkbM family methyltransferase